MSWQGCSSSSGRDAGRVVVGLLVCKSDLRTTIPTEKSPATLREDSSKATDLSDFKEKKRPPR